MAKMLDWFEDRFGDDVVTGATVPGGLLQITTDKRYIRKPDVVLSIRRTGDDTFTEVKRFWFNPEKEGDARNAMKTYAEHYYASIDGPKSDTTATVTPARELPPINPYNDRVGGYPVTYDADANTGGSGTDGVLGTNPPQAPSYVIPKDTSKT